MRQKPSEPLTAYQFGRALLEANDLDPVYVILHESDLDRKEKNTDETLLERWLIAYWCFYHVGTASWILDGGTEHYWPRMRTAAGSKEYPRSSERRHFRGIQAVKSVAYLEGRGVYDLFTELYAEEDGAGSPATRPVSAQAVIDRVQNWRGFGPWIAFKVADMLERLGMLSVTFDVGTAMYEGSPTEATAVLRDWEQPGWEPESQAELSEWAVQRVTNELADLTAPPRHERPLGPQEAETVLCKWKSYLNGHYHVGEDVAAVRNGLLRFITCPTARKLLRAGAKGGLW